MEEKGRSRRPRRSEVLVVYVIGLFQGLSLVAFPAAATVLTSSGAYDLSKSRYGLLFLPQVIMAIGGSLALPALGRRLGLKRVLVIGLVADTVSMILLASSNPVQTSAAAYPMLLAATAALGLGFGLTLGSISTYAGSFMPERRDVALTALNVLLGLGTALSPFLVAIFLDHGEWWYLPLISAAGLVVLLVVVLRSSMPAPVDESARHRVRLPATLWLFAAVLVLYGVAETMFGNWGTTLLVGHHVSAPSANEALSAFWIGVTIGRLVISVASAKLRSTRIYVVLPWLVALALLVVPSADNAGAGIGLFLFGGLACSGFFPMTIGYGESTFPAMVELATGWLIAAYQLGYGLAAFGGGAMQSVVSLTTVFRVVGVATLAMALLSVRIARLQPAPVAAAPQPGGSA